jgi:hypothetical protein
MSTYKLPTNINNRPPQIVDLGWVGCIQFDPNDSAPDYIGMHLDKDATDGDSEWKVYKFTYDGTYVTKFLLGYGTCTGRAGIF